MYIQRYKIEQEMRQRRRVRLFPGDCWPLVPGPNHHCTLDLTSKGLSRSCDFVIFVHAGLYEDNNYYPALAQG